MDWRVEGQAGQQHKSWGSHASMPTGGSAAREFNALQLLLQPLCCSMEGSSCGGWGRGNAMRCDDGEAGRKAFLGC